MAQLIHTTDDGIYPASLGYKPDPGRLSPNGARKLIQPAGPAKFDWERRHPPQTKSVFDFGHAAHRFVLGEGEDIAPICADNWTTKAAKEQRDNARAEGLVPLLEKDVDKAIEMANKVRAHSLAAGLLAEGDAENWLYATDPETGQGLRQRLDWMTRASGGLTIVEYKTAADADPHVFARKAFDFGYHIAFAFAVTLARLLELDDAPSYLFIVQEKEPPYLISVCELDAEALAVGRRRMREAIAIYRRCIEAGEWPGYPPEIHSVSLPMWAVDEEMEI